MYTEDVNKIALNSSDNKRLQTFDRATTGSGDSGSGETNALINLINEQNDIDKMYWYARDLSKPNYEYLIKKHEDVGIKHLNNPNTFIECWNTMDDVYDNINDYNLNIRKILIVFDNMIADIMTKKDFQAII